MRKITTTSWLFYEIWLMPVCWTNVCIEEDYLDTRVVTILIKYLDRVRHFRAKVIHEYPHNRPLNAMLFSMYNLVSLDLSGCAVVRNFDFLQIMFQLEILDISNCARMSAMSLVRSVNEMRVLRVFICQNNFISAFMIYQAVCHLDTVQTVACCDSGFMRPYIARWLLNNCKAIEKFYFTSNFEHDDNIDKLQWYIILRNKFPAVQLTKEVNEKIDEYVKNCPSIRCWRQDYE